MSIVTHPRHECDARVAVALIQHRARMSVLKDLVPIFPYKTLLSLYREIHGKATTKGQLPFSHTRFLCWEENVHASLFYNYYRFMARSIDHRGELLVRAYDFYKADIARFPDYTEHKPFFTINRAWVLLRLLGGRYAPLTTVCCSRCGGLFIRENHNTISANRCFVCVMCRPPNNRKERRAHRDF